MNRIPKIAFLATIPLLLLVARICSYASESRKTIIGIEMKENRVDGCTACGCRVPGDIEGGKRGEWWLAFGVVRPSAGGRWDAVAASSYCGSGRFRQTASDFLVTVGTPYLIADLALLPAKATPDGPQMPARLAVQKFTGYGADGRAAYESRTEERALPLARDGDLALPLLIADPGEKEAFGIHEIMLRMRTSLLAREARSYGAIAVTADVPAASVLLDGGFVGRIAEGAPVLLGNVLSGDRDLRVVDFSGRAARRTVRVVEGRNVQAALSVLNLPPDVPAGGLHPVGRNPQGFEEYWRLVDGALVVRIPSGGFPMGSPEGRGEPNERPQHKVHVSAFLIDKTEVTWRQMRRFHQATGHPLPKAPISGSPDHYPASNILWDEAGAYCRWVGGRLPTEAEWEKAARGTDGREYPWGDRFEADRCNTISGGLHRVEDVGSYPGCLSPYGVLDLAGGMWEWCADWYAEDYYARSPAADPPGPETGTLRVTRGGAWMSQPTWVRSAYRARGVASSGNVDYGFRCAQEVPAE